MRKTPILYKLTGTTFVVAIFLASCNLPSSSVPPATAAATQPPVASPVAPSATQPPVPAATNVTVPTATATVASTATPAPTATTQLTAQVVPSINAYCRKGPGSDYYEITFLQSGTAYNVVGRNSLNTWWLVQAPGNLTCWMGDPGATQQGPVDQAVIAQAQPLPVTPATFVDSVTCNATLHTLSVAFNWSTVANATGYRIFRNGTQITDVAPPATAFTDASAPQGTNLVYGLEAHNDYGVAPRISVSVPSCN